MPDRPHRIAWARLLKRVFDIDMQHLPELRRRGTLKIIAAILERPVIEKILTHLGTGSAAAASEAERARSGKTDSRLSRVDRPGHRTHHKGLRSLAPVAGGAAPACGLDGGKHRVNPRSRPNEREASRQGGPNPDKATAQAPVPSHPGRHRLPTQG
jgi:hypothetical protein